MIRFTIFGIPVSIEPLFWVMCFFMGGGLNSLNSQAGLIEVAVWTVVVLTSVLVHELGHALTGRKLSGGAVWIKLVAFGGVAYQQGGRFSKKDRALMIAAGPGAGFLLLAISAAACFVLIEPIVALDILKKGTIGLIIPNLGYSTEFISFVSDPENKMKELIFYYFFKVNFFWGLLNLLPVSPLDGGQLLDLYITSRKKLYKIGMITAGIMIFLGVAYFKSMLIPILFAFLAYQNYMMYKQSNY